MTQPEKRPRERRVHRWRLAARVAALLALLGSTSLTACSASTPTAATASTVATAATATAPPAATATSGSAASIRSTGGHVVIAMMENHAYSQIIGSRDAPYLSSLARSGANLTRMSAITHPSQPNYVALFTGSTHGVIDDRCPVHVPGANLGTQLLHAHLGFAGYAEGLPRTGSTTCVAGPYARKHVPWADSADLPPSVNRPFTDFPHDFASLPTVSFVVPDLDHDMHNGSVAQGDSWVRTHLSAYASWARTHQSLLIVTWDEDDDRSAANRIPTIIVGAGVRAHTVDRAVTLYSLLRLVEDRYALPHLGAAARAASIPLA